MSRYNNVEIVGSRVPQRVLDCLQRGEFIRSSTIANRLGVHPCTVRAALDVLKSRRMVIVKMESRHPKYGLGNAGKRTVSSEHVAGPVTIGKGLANW